MLHEDAIQPGGPWANGALNQEVEASHAPSSAVTGSSAEAREAPEIDIDTWFAQRTAITDKLLQRRKLLLEELKETDERLKVLGVELEAKNEAPARAQRASRAPVQRPNPRFFKQSVFAREATAQAKEVTHVNKPNGAMTTVLGAMSKARESMEKIEQRTGLPHKVVYGALKYAHKMKKVRRIGDGAAALWSLP